MSRSVSSRAGLVLAGLLVASLAACSGAAPAPAATATPASADPATRPEASAEAQQSAAPVAYPATLRVGQLGATKVTEALLQASGEDQGLPYAIEWSLFPGGGPGFLEAAVGGNVDVGSMADTPPIFAQANGIPVRVIAAKQLPADVSTVELYTAVDSPINGVADLAGRKVALTVGTILQYTVIRALEQAGLSYDDIEVVNLPPPDALTAFQSGDVDAIAILDPQRSIVKAAGARKIGDGVGITAGLSFVVATDAALADPAIEAAIADYLPRLIRAEAWADANPEAWAEIYAGLTGLPLPVVQSVVTHDDAQYLPIDQAVLEAQQLQADTYTQVGVLPAQLDTSLEFDTRFNDLVAGVVE